MTKKILCLLFGLYAFFSIAPIYANQYVSLSDSRAASLLSLNQDLQPSTPAWPTPNYNLTSFLNFDITPKTMQKTLPGEEHDYLALSNVGINLDAKILSSVLVHAGIAYFKTNKGQGDRYKNTGIMLDDASVTLANFDTSPLFAQVGLVYLPFGENDRYAIIPSLTQVLTIARAATGQLGIANWNNITGSVYVAQGQLKDGSKKIQGAINYGADLFYKYTSDSNAIFSAGVQYIYNMLNTNALSESQSMQMRNYIYSKHIPGIAAQIEVGMHNISLFARYVTALSTSSDLIRKYMKPTDALFPVYGAKPSAYDLGIIIKMNPWQKQSSLDFTYSHSKQMAGLYVFNSTLNHGVPERRYILGYTFYLNQHLYTRFQWGHDWLYEPGHGDTGRQGDDATLRIGVNY